MINLYEWHEQLLLAVHFLGGGSIGRPRSMIKDRTRVITYILPLKEEYER